MRGRKRKLPHNYVPPAYIGSSGDSDEVQHEPPLQRHRREVHQQQPVRHEDENFWIDIDVDLFMSDHDDPQHVRGEEVVLQPDVRPPQVRGEEVGRQADVRPPQLRGEEVGRQHDVRPPQLGQEPEPLNDVNSDEEQDEQGNHYK